MRRLLLALTASIPRYEDGLVRWNDALLRFVLISCDHEKCTSAFPDLDHEAYEIWGKGCRLGFSKINADDYYWYMTFDSDPDKNSSPLARRAHAESLLRKFFPKWTALLENTQSDEILQTDLTDLKRLTLVVESRRLNRRCGSRHNT